MNVTKEMRELVAKIIALENQIKSLEKNIPSNEEQIDIFISKYVLNDLMIKFETLWHTSADPKVLKKVKEIKNVN